MKLTTAADHAAVLAEVERLMKLNPARGTADSDRLDALVDLAEKYEEEHFPVPRPTREESAAFRVEQSLPHPREVDVSGLTAFIAESNRIENIARPPTWEEFQAHCDLLQAEAVTVANVANFVHRVAGERLRDRRGMNVQVGDHLPPRGGPRIITQLEAYLEDANRNIRGEFGPKGRCLAHEIHLVYELLHPFMDGNGRSGRVIWLWMHLHHPLGEKRALEWGFLRTFYYETLRRENERTARERQLEESFAERVTHGQRKGGR